MAVVDRCENMVTPEKKKKKPEGTYNVISDSGVRPHQSAINSSKPFVPAPRQEEAAEGENWNSTTFSPRSATLLHFLTSCDLSCSTWISSFPPISSPSSYTHSLSPTSSSQSLQQLGHNLQCGTPSQVDKVRHPDIQPASQPASLNLASPSHRPSASPSSTSPSSLHYPTAYHSSRSHSFPTSRRTTIKTNTTTNTQQANHHPANPDHPPSVLHPRVAVLLGVARHWHLPLLFCRALSTAPAVWWGLRCALTFLRELLLLEDGGIGRHGSAGIAAGGYAEVWSIEKRFKVTEVFLAVLWCLSSAWLSFYFTDCLMSRWLLNYTPQATLVRLLTINSINAYITSWVLYLSGGSEDPRLLLPAWISIASTLTISYHMVHPRLAILKETSLSISVFSIASFISMVSLLLQLHLSRTNSPSVPLFSIVEHGWGYVKTIVEALGIGAHGREL